jgi:transcriptional regulator with XRE-family HTH domain
MANKQMTPLQQGIQHYEDLITHAQEQLAKAFMEEIQEEMERIDLSRADLALTLDLNRSQVSRLLNKPGNPTLRTLISLASAVDHELQFQLRPTKTVAMPLHPNVVPQEDWLGLLKTCHLAGGELDPNKTEWAIAGNGK